VSYQVILKRSAERKLDTIRGKLFGHIKRKLLALEDNPRPFGVEKLHGQEGYRLRVGDHRILYLINDAMKRVEVIAIRHRREAYR